jgi:methyltransferase family protein
LHRELPIDPVMSSSADSEAAWDELYSGKEGGDERSAGWGGVPYQWWVTLFPRLQGYVPADRILEIAPGFGRWTHFLKSLCRELVIVDIAEPAIEHCRERFANDPHVIAHLNHGTSLSMVANRSIDLGFSVDSLVNAEIDVMSAYLEQIELKLTDSGVAFLHHSNIGAYAPGTYDQDNIAWRAASVSAVSIEFAADRAGLSCVSQELIAWGQEQLLNDCFSVLTRRGLHWDRTNVVVENRGFSTQEIAMAKRISTQYPPSTPDVEFTAVRR